MIYYEDNLITLRQGHIITELRSLPSESVHMVCTSPPYWGLRDYGLEPQVWDDPLKIESDLECRKHEWGERGPDHHPGQVPDNKAVTDENAKGQTAGSGQFCLHCNAWRGSLGLEPTPELFIQHIVQVFGEIWRVARPDCTVWVNIGDSYASVHTGGHKSAKSTVGANKEGVQEIRQPKSAPSSYGLKEKDLCGIPWRAALALQADGWWLRSDIIWSKPNPMPESVTDRPTRSHEYVFLLTKSGTSQFWVHRDHAGSRTRPKADWRWVNQITDEEVAAAPEDWKRIIKCPNCEGTGRALIDCSCEIMGQWMENWVEDECPVCEGKKKVQRWKRINLWRGHDYFFDMEAIKIPASPDSHRRYARGRSDSHKYSDGGPGNQTIAKSLKHMIKPAGVHPKAVKPGQGIKQNESFSAAVKDIVGYRNLRSVWTIPTQAFPQAHFATFPEQLASTCIKAGTSEKGCCPECGAPWVRVVEKPEVPNDKFTETQKPDDKLIAGWRKDGKFRGSGQKYQNWKEANPDKTIGWKPSCECFSTFGISKYTETNTDVWKPIPCTVLDPFAGSCRALIVAKKLGRRGIGIDLKGEYLEMPLKELAQSEFEFK